MAAEEFRIQWASGGNGGGKFRTRWASRGKDGGGFPGTRDVWRKWRRRVSEYKGRPEEMAAEDFRIQGASGRKMAAEKYETYGDLRVMKINGNKNGMMGGDIGMLDETMNNKRKWVWGC